MKKHISWFNEVSIKDIPLVGGKGASLGEMYGKFSVPNGFCITVHAYDQFLEENLIREKILKLLEIDVENHVKLEHASEKIKKIILKAKIPKDVKKEIINHYKKLKGKVAVRSSATAEDLPTASFAGQQDTYLNIKGERNVIEAVHKCWASLFTARAIYYREKNKFKHKDVLISVVIQKMIDAEHAGVMFTVDPVNKKYLLIEMVKGLGEALVSGAVTPNSYFLHKPKLEIFEKDEDFEFDNKLLKQIAKIGMKIEKHYKKPMDVELAVKNNKIYILQARPITTL